MKTPRWILIGFRFRKYLIIGISGMVLIISSLLVLLKDVDIGHLQLGAAVFLGVLGMYLVLVFFARIVIRFINVFSNGIPRKPKKVKDIGDILYRRKVLSSGPKVVVIGGGTGISTMLRGLKHYTSNITAIITVADDGGGSGQLRCDLGMLPPGDIRNCMVALAETEPVLERLMNYRFPEGRLKGQSFGNLFLAAMCGISGNNFVQAVTHMGEVLAVTGRIYPVTDENVNLVATLKDGTVVRGESRIGSHHLFHPGPIDMIRFDREPVRPLKEVIDAIGKADVIVMGPGSLYTSIIPNLLVDQVPQAISKAKGIRVYVCNVMTQPGETEDYTVADHIEAVHKHAGCRLIDYCLVNNSSIDPSLLERYREEGATPVELDLSRTRRLGVKVIEKDMMGVHNGYVRHDPEKLAHAIMDIYRDK